MGISPPYARHRAARIGIRIHLLPMLVWFGARGERRLHRMRVIPRGSACAVLKAMSRTSSPTMFRHGRNPVIGLQEPGGIWSGARISAASGIGEYDYINHIHAGTFSA